MPGTLYSKQTHVQGHHFCEALCLSRSSQGPTTASDARVNPSLSKKHARTVRAAPPRRKRITPTGQRDGSLAGITKPKQQSPPTCVRRHP